MADFFQPGDYDCIVRKEGEHWVAEYPDIPGVCAQGDSKLKALGEAETILASWLANAGELGMEIPVPGEARSASGEFKARVPRTLHCRLAAVAAALGLSLNELTTQFLTAAVARTFSDGAHGTGVQCHRLPAGKPTTATTNVRDYSGVWVQRVPRVLHLHLQRLAEAEGVSLNALVIHLLSHELGTVSALQWRSNEVAAQAA